MPRPFFPIFSKHLSAYGRRALALPALALAALLLFSACDEATPFEADPPGADKPAASPLTQPARVTATPATTQAPDLVEVSNVREGADVNGTGGDDTDTYVDFTLDERSTIASCCSRFQIIPADGGEPLAAIDVLKKGQKKKTFTVVFEETFVADDVARGTIDDGILESTATGLTNAPQAAPVTDGADGTTSPDLVSVTRDGDQLLFEFDEAIDEDDDVIQNTSGLRFFTANAETYSSSNVKPLEGSSTTLRAIYDLPEGVTLQDAVAGFVLAGTVVGDPNTNDFNELDEVAPVGSTGAVVCAAAPETGETGDGSGLTEAPDLLEVGNFRRGPFTDEFEPTTCVDFVFDQAAYLNGGTRSNFNLVPLDASDALPGSTNQTPEAEVAGDRVVTIIFPGDLSAENFARGYVDSGVVNSDCCNASADNPYNISQAQPTAPNTTTENPDLVSVSRDGGAFLFEFDEALTDDDVAQNSSGLRLYFPEAKQQSTIPFASSSGVEVVNDRTLRAFYNTFPADYTAEDAVGAYAVQGSVQAAIGSRGGNDGKNAFDEVAPIQVVDATTCAPSAGVGGTGDGSGLTEAPDLLEVGNFREGPFTSQFEPTTCVDFTFDQVAYLNGGTRSNFQLVPLDAGDALSGSTNIKPTATQDPDGDNIVTVIFPGDLSPADFARGYVDTGVVNSDCCTANAANPYNINQAQPTAPNTATENPDLVSVTRDGDSFLFEFDEALTDDDVAQNSSGLRLYFPEAKQQSTIPFASSAGVEVVNDRTLRAFYNTYPADYGIEDAVGAYVVQGSVQAVIGSRGGNDGKNAFDEVTPIQVADATVCEPSAGVGGTGDGSGPTEAPDLLSVGNFREGPRTTQFEPTTCVDFTFDQVAYLNGGDRSNFSLVPLDASDAISGSTNVTPNSTQDPSGDTIVTVIFEGDLSPADFARGFIDTGVVNSAASNISAENPLNINQAANIGPNTLTENPDLAQDLNAVERQSDVWLYFVFDEPLTDDDIVQSTSGLRVYFPATSQGSTIPDAGAIKVKVVDDRTLRAKFKDLPEGYRLRDAVGAFVVQGTVQAAEGSRGGNDGKSAFDETFLTIDWPGSN